MVKVLDCYQLKSSNVFDTREFESHPRRRALCCNLHMSFLFIILDKWIAVGPTTASMVISRFFLEALLQIFFVNVNLPHNCEKNYDY